MTDSESFTLRVPRKLYRRIMDAIAATGSEVTRTDVFLQGAELLLAQLEVCPAILNNYNPELDKSARQKSRKQGKKCDCNAVEDARCAKK